MDQIKVINVFQDEFHRILTPMEKEIINDWAKEYSEETIIGALKDAVFNGVSNLRYINKILKSSKSETQDQEDQNLDWLK